MMTTAFQWADGSSLKADADVVGQRLMALVEKNGGGGLRAADIVADATDVASPLHGLFEWDDVVAAQRHRETQAQYILRHLHVVQVNGETAVMRAFVSMVEEVGDDTIRQYVPIARVISEHELYAQALEQALRELHAFERKYAAFVELAEITIHARKQIEQLLKARTVEA